LKNQREGWSLDVKRSEFVNLVNNVPKFPRILKLAEKFINPKGAAIAFQKNAWNSLRAEQGPEYSIGAARAGMLRGTLKGHNDLTLFCVPPTRLAGPCRRVLTQILKNM